ncbi:MAG: hypothetical protein ACM3X0_04695, partial [Bacteroidota bacterium]
MSKLLKLKEWLTVPEAATRLSGIFEEQVTEADVLRLALDKKLTLSIRFRDDIVIRPCKFVQHHEGSLEEAVETVSDFSTKEGRPINCKKLEIDDDQCLVFDGEMAISDGVWEPFRQLACRLERLALRGQIPCRHGSNRTHHRCRIYDCMRYP